MPITFKRDKEIQVSPRIYSLVDTCVTQALSNAQFGDAQVLWKDGNIIIANKTEAFTQKQLNTVLEQLQKHPAFKNAVLGTAFPTHQRPGSKSVGSVPCITLDKNWLTDCYKFLLQRAVRDLIKEKIGEQEKRSNAAINKDTGADEENYAAQPFFEFLDEASENQIQFNIPIPILDLSNISDETVQQHYAQVGSWASSRNDLFGSDLLNACLYHVLYMNRSEDDFVDQLSNADKKLFSNQLKEHPEIQKTLIDARINLPQSTIRRFFK